MFSKQFRPTGSWRERFLLSSRVYLVFVILHHIEEAVCHRGVQLALITDSDFESSTHGSKKAASKT